MPYLKQKIFKALQQRLDSETLMKEGAELTKTPKDLSTTEKGSKPKSPKRLKSLSTFRKASYQKRPVQTKLKEHRKEFWQSHV